MSLINNYIIPLIRDTKLNDINTRFLEKFYQSMTQMPRHINPISGRGNEHISPSTIRDIHKLLRSAFQQAVKWELVDKNPAVNAITLKWKKKERVFLFAASGRAVRTYMGLCRYI